MNIIFKEIPGEIYDLFYGLWFMNNYDFAKDRKESFGVFSDNPYEKAIMDAYKANILQTGLISDYFLEEFEPRHFLPYTDLWDSNSLDDYLSYLKDLGDENFRNIIIHSICSIASFEEEINQDVISQYTYDNDSILGFLKDKNIAENIKWKLFMFLKDKDKYIDKLIELLNSYFNLSGNLNKMRKDILKAFNKEMEENLKRKGIGFLEKKINKAYDFNKFETVYVTTSLLSSLVITDIDGRTCKVVIGPYIDDLTKNLHSQDNLEDSLFTLKTICDMSRFRIIQLLMEKDYYGQEIADILGLTKSTISHHLSNLVALDIVHVNRDSQKIFYSLRMENIESSIESLIRELKLEDKNLL